LPTSLPKEARPELAKCGGDFAHQGLQGIPNAPPDQPKTGEIKKKPLVFGLRNHYCREAAQAAVTAYFFTISLFFRPNYILNPAEKPVFKGTRMFFTGFMLLPLGIRRALRSQCVVLSVF
jgi:hypothetical protein